jgi:hypothetical protein
MVLLSSDPLCETASKLGYNDRAIAYVYGSYTNIKRATEVNLLSAIFQQLLLQSSASVAGLLRVSFQCTPSHLSLQAFQHRPETHKVLYNKIYRSKKRHRTTSKVKRRSLRLKYSVMKCLKEDDTSSRRCHSFPPFALSIGRFVPVRPYQRTKSNSKPSGQGSKSIN